jgi:hypothetical protein
VGLLCGLLATLAVVIYLVFGPLQNRSHLNGDDYLALFALPAAFMLIAWFFLRWKGLVVGYLIGLGLVLLSLGLCFGKDMLQFFA